TSLNVFARSEPVERMFERCRRAGFDAVDYNYTDHQFEFAEMSAAQHTAIAKEVNRASRQAGLPVVQMHGPIFRKFADDPKARQMHELSLRCFDFAAEIGCPWVVFEPDVLPGSFTRDHWEANLAANVDLFAAFAAAAARAGTGVAIENVADAPRAPRRQFGATPAELVLLVEKIEMPNVGICWDTGHAHLQGLDQQAALASLGAHLVALHIADNDRSGDSHLLPFMGTVDWRSVLQGLHAAGYEGAFAYEVHNAFRMPDPLRDGLLEYAARLGKYLTSSEFVRSADA
ncbi:MAG TPA: sugar phosphate isomerase/epimerase, partial [Limnochordia bacterium]